MEYRNQEVQALRAVAVLFVLFEHSSALLETTPDWLRRFEQHYFEFWTGVDIFFAISGYVIASSLLRKIGDRPERGSKETWLLVFEFWIRRVFRIWPSAIFWMFVALGLTLYLPNRNAPGQLADMLSSILQVQNLHDYFCQTRGAICGRYMGHYWSLSLEEQFYVALPLLWVFLSKKHLLWGLLALIALQAGMQRSVHHLDWYLRTDAIAWGVLVARLQGSWAYQVLCPSFLRARIFRWPVIGLCLLVIAAAGISSQLPYYVGFAALGAAALVFFASYDAGYVVHPGAIRTILVWIGERSFGLYLIHYMLFIFVMDQTGGVPVSFSVSVGRELVALVATFVLADLNYRLLERPMIEKGQRVGAAFVSRGMAIKSCSELSDSASS